MKLHLGVGHLTAWNLSNFSAANVPGLVTDFDDASAANFSFSSGMVVSQWKDNSGTGRNATQGNISQQPTYVPGSGVYFNGTTQRLMFDMTELAGSDYTIFTVAQLINPSAQQWLISGNGQGTNQVLQVFYNGGAGVGNGQYGNDIQANSPSPISLGGPGLISCRLSQTIDGGGRVLRYNGVQIASESTTTQLISMSGGTLGIGNFNNGYNATGPFDGYFRRALIYAGGLTDPQVSYVENGLIAKYGIH